MLRHLFLIVPFLLLVHVSSAAALPGCPTVSTEYFHNCEGTRHYPNGDRARGEWKGDQLHGRGKYIFFNGDKYVGEFKNGKRHGQGTFYYLADNEFKGGTYVGEYRDGKRHGHGTFTWADGDKYVGEFRDGLGNGIGMLTIASNSSKAVSGRSLAGAEYVGEVRDQEVHGNGTIFFSNGDVWLGRFRNNNWVDGNKYTAGNVPPEVYAARGGDAPPSSQNKPPQQQTQGSEPEEIIPASSGSGFVISKAGHIVNNHHVIDGCNQVEVHQKGKGYKATVIEIDIINDLAVLQANFAPTAIFSINSQNAQLSQDVWVAGYPFGDALSTSVKVTKGIVSSLAGIGNNYSNMQIDAALQPGNSGGPILDEHGNVVGVAVAKLDLKLSLEAFDVVPENTNFGIKSSVLKNFLDANGIATLQASDGAISTAERARKITDGTLFLSCLMTYAQIEKLRAEKVMFSDLD